MHLKRLALSLLLPLAGVAATPVGIPDGWPDDCVCANGIRLQHRHFSTL
jgi:hypothetical protein